VDAAGGVAERCRTWQAVLRAALLLLWAAASFGVAWFARDLSATVAGWPLNFWLAAQGSVLVFLLVVVVYAWAMNRCERQRADQGNDR